VYETVSLHLHERAANSFLRAQAVFDTVTAGKMAAAAASAAAVAGGGFAVEGVVSSPSGDRPAAILRGAAGSAALPVLKTASRRHVNAQRMSSSHRKAPARQRPRSQPRAVTSSRRPQSAAAKTTATTTAAPTTQLHAAAASAGRSRPGASAAGEFGFEGP
jgi:hypothetical protein